MVALMNIHMGRMAARLKRRGVRLSVSSIALLAMSAGAALQPAQAQQTAAAQSEAPGAAWPAIVAPRKGAPNILLIMTDDVGFGATSVFGGPVPTPNLEKLAANGVRYNQFNTTALCSPTRAALLTGRNPHRVGMGNVNNLATGYEGYTSVIPKSAGMVAETLRSSGYATAAFGKWHLTPEWEQSAYGPFDRWPTGEGFNYFYGFHGGDTDQFSPSLFENTIPIELPHDDPNYILDNDLATRTIRWIDQQRALAPDHPFFVYMAPGTAHSPHSAPKEWLEKFRGKFDGGWDVLREQIFVRQKKMGIIPASAKLTPRPDFFPAWNSLSPDRKQLYSRMMEAYAAALAYNDHEIGRVIDSLKASGQFDNTLIIAIEGDNGASAEGGLQGLLAEETMINGYEEDFDYLLKHIDDIGGPRARNHYPAMWAWALNTPFQYYKQVASHWGGIRNGLIVSWPGKLEKSKVVRDQFLYVTDVAPTILEAAGIAQPDVQDGVKQMPMDGISFAYTFADPSAAPKRNTQVFEMMQNAGIYHEGWMASTRPAAAPWNITSKALNVPLSDRKWELYNVAKDYSQATDLAAKYPAKLEELKKLFLVEAENSKILPLHSISDGREGRPSLTTGRDSFAYHAGLTRVPENSAPHLIGRSFEIDADIVVPQAGVSGVLVTQGGRFGGYAFYLKDNRPVFHYNMVGDRQYVIRSDVPVPPGSHRLTARFAIDQPSPGSGGVLTLLLDGSPVGSGKIEHTHRTWISNSEGFDVGQDTITPISDDYTIGSSRFTGELKELRIDLK
jgi:arylsulfatase